MRNLHLLTTHLPDFLKMDLSVGSADAHPITLALDSWLTGESHRRALETHSSQPGLGSARLEERELTRHGFKVTTLNEAQRNALYQSLNTIFATRLQLTALELLSQITFGNATVRRGHPYERHSLGFDARLPLRLSEANDTNVLLFVQTESAVADVVAMEFLHNAAILAPAGYRVKLSGARTSSPPARNVIALVANTRMKGWRL